MNTHKILLGALLIKPNLAPYALPDLEIEYFPADLQPVFAALSGFWNATGKLDAVEACARYPEQSTAIVNAHRRVKQNASASPVKPWRAGHSSFGNRQP